MFTYLLHECHQQVIVHQFQFEQGITQNIEILILDLF